MVNMAEPLISIVMPVYNTEQYIGESIESILNQEFKNYELICVNDGSSDNSVNILRKYAERDGRIRLLDNENNRGSSYARNCAMRIARGKYIFFVDSDDRICSGTLETLYHCAEETNCTSIYYGLKHLYRENACVPQPDSEYLKGTGYINLFSGIEFLKRLSDENLMSFAIGRQFFNRLYLVNHNIEFHEGIICEDCFFTIKALLNSERVCYLKSELYEYWHRKGSNSKSFLNAHNLYSMFCVFKDLDNYWRELSMAGRLSKEAELVIGEYYKSFFFETKNIYIRLSEAEKNVCKQKLSYHDKIDFELFFELKAEGVKCKNISADQLNYIKQYEKVVIYGAGVFGIDVYNILKESGIPVWRFAVTNIQENQKEIDGIRVESISNIAEYRKNDGNKLLIIIGVTNKNRIPLIKKLEQLGVTDYLCI